MQDAKIETEKAKKEAENVKEEVLKVQKALEEEKQKTGGKK